MNKSYLVAMVRRGRRAVDRHGIVTVVHRGLRFAANRLLKRLRGEPTRTDLAKPNSFDVAHAVNTVESIDDEIALARVSSPNWRHGFRYQRSSADRFRCLVDALSIAHRDYLFVDFGSGKGLILLLAAEYPFRKIIGVEYCSSLHAAAEKNLASYRSPTQKCHDLVSVCADAITFRLPEGPAVLYFACPFDAVVLDPVVANVRQALAKSTGKSYVLYYNALYADVFQKHGFVEIARQTDNIGTHLILECPRE